MQSGPFDEVRVIVKERFKADDAALLLTWLLTHFTDEGAIRSPQAPRRKRIVLDGVAYLLVRDQRRP